MVDIMVCYKNWEAKQTIEQKYHSSAKYIFLDLYTDCLFIRDTPMAFRFLVPAIFSRLPKARKSYYGPLNNGAFIDFRPRRGRVHSPQSIVHCPPSTVHRPFLMSATALD